ncbi:Inner membrane protein YrbG, predicted calcium/sodium:proton antiporter [Chitinispirillum alkaliphilum]|nr:Inner membrane protein YrbG, predicted calcium/sodium:proton antiporter [Chitinispirillum alkaliphilum]
MDFIQGIVTGNVLLAWLLLVAAFILLTKSADLFVESAVVIADRFGIPKLIIGIVLVSLATSAPEITVSIIAALRGRPEMALGNAIGSVICNDGLALGMAGLIATGAIAIQPQVLKTAGVFLLLSQALTFIFVLNDYTIQRWQGAILALILTIYIITFYFQNQRSKTVFETQELMEIEEEIEKDKSKPLLLYVLFFLLALGGIIISSEIIVTSSIMIASRLAIPESVIALTVIALGTSLPEIATSIVAVRKGHGELAVGNILGSDILNICFVIGVSSIVNPLTLTRREAFFMFPWMFIVVGAMFLMLRTGYRLTRKKGIVLISVYLLYLLSFFLIFPT